MPTIRDAYTLYQQRTDLQSDAYLSPPMFVPRYATERSVWMRDKAEAKETEYIRRMMAPFRTEKRIQVTDRAFRVDSLPDGAPPVAYVRSLTADFGALKNRACRPVTDDEFAIASTDPTRKPDDWFPAYRETDGQIQILSRTSPAYVTLAYWKQPGALSLTQDTASNLTEGQTAMQEIVERVIASQSLTTGDAQRYQITTGREIPARENNP